MIAFVCTTQAQQPAPWVKFEPVDDFFSVSMPNLPKEESQAVSFAGLQVSGKWYSAGSADASYALWSLIDTNHNVTRDADSYLDAAGELFWEALLKPARENLPEHQRAQVSVTYVKELSDKQIPGREYTLTLAISEERLMCTSPSSASWCFWRWIGPAPLGNVRGFLALCPSRQTSADSARGT